MKPFNLEQAKQGKPVVTRSGLPVRIVCFDAKINKPIVALVDYGYIEDIYYFNNEGRDSDSYETCMDLFMQPETKTGWINVYKSEICEEVYGGIKIYPTKEDAIHNSNVLRIDTIQITFNV